MKIRTITGFLYLHRLFDKKVIADFSEKLHALKKAVSKKFAVQFIRISFQNIDQLLNLKASTAELIHAIQKLEKTCNEVGLQLINIGTITGKSLNATNIQKVAEILKHTNWVFGSVKIDRWNEAIFEACARVYKTLSTAEKNGLANIKYSTLFNVPPFSPFYPGAYHTNKTPGFAVGLEWGDELIAASKKAETLPEFARNIPQMLEKKLKPLEKNFINESKKMRLEYRGIDLSLATSLGKIGTLLPVWKHFGLQFGENGSLALARAITKGIEDTKIKKCGYSGLMIPVFEDYGLAKISKSLNVQQILTYSAVCGTGLDAIPLPGEISVRELSNILKDIYALSEKWGKPLSARLFPIPGKKKQERTNMRCPYLVDAYVM